MNKKAAASQDKPRSYTQRLQEATIARLAERLEASLASSPHPESPARDQRQGPATSNSQPLTATTED